jgi:hypothetical protein
VKITPEIAANQNITLSELRAWCSRWTRVSAMV